MKINSYINDIVTRSCLPWQERMRVKKDLRAEINEAFDRGEYPEQIMERMGEPDEIARELYENHCGRSDRPFKEYKSSFNVMGLPLYHIIKTKYRRNGVRLGTMEYERIHVPAAKGFFAVGSRARGVFAFGNLSCGVVAFGNLSAGIISVGNISAGIFTLGNIGLGLLASFGNVAAGLFSFGNVAAGYAAAGNAALGRYAAGNSVCGDFAFKIPTDNIASGIGSVREFFSNAPGPVRSFFDFAASFIENLFLGQNAGIKTTAAVFCAAALISLPFIISRVIISRDRQ